MAKMTMNLDDSELYGDNINSDIYEHGIVVNKNIDVNIVTNEQYKITITESILNKLAHSYKNDSTILSNIQNLAKENLNKKIGLLTVHYGKNKPTFSVLPNDTSINHLYIDEARKICEKIGLNVIMNPKLEDLNKVCSRDFIIMNYTVEELTSILKSPIVEDQKTIEKLKNVKSGLFLLESSNQSNLDRKTIKSIISKSVNMYSTSLLTHVSSENVLNIGVKFSDYKFFNIIDAPQKIHTDNVNNDQKSKNQVENIIEKLRKEHLQAKSNNYSI